MTEKDLSLKAASRRLMWRMGFTTKVDVPLRAFVPQTKSGGRARSQFEAFTDLDVLGVQVTPDLRVQSVIADCKTSAKGSTERMFWIRGVADFFGADDAYMVRQDDATAAARQLASRLRIAVLTSTDLSLLEGHYPTDMPPVDYLFDPIAIADYRQALTKLDKRLQPLREYQEFDFWVYDEHRNLQQVIAHLNDVSKHLDPSNPAHQALFFESAWRYALAIARAAHQVRRAHVADVDTSLREYLFGGQLALREKQQLAKVLRAAAGKADSHTEEGIFPSYFAALLELTSRFLRRPLHVGPALRYAEWAAEAHHARSASPASAVFAAGYDDIAAKLLADVCGFLVTTAGLDIEFRARARQLLAPANSESDATPPPERDAEAAQNPQGELPISQPGERLRDVR